MTTAQTLPTYANAIAAPTLAQVAADLLSRFPSTVLQGWSDDAPQRQLVNADAQALQFEMIQRALVARAASPANLLTLAPWLVTQGYSAADAATIQAAWVDVALQWYGNEQDGTPFARLPAVAAQWNVPIASTSPQTITATSVIVLQALDGQFFLSAAQANITLVLSGGLYCGTVPFVARAAGTGGNETPGQIQFVNQGTAGLTVDLTGTQVQTITGTNAEGDASAVARALARWDALGVGWTSTAFNYLIPFYARTVTRWIVNDANPIGPGSVTVALANASGPATTQEVALVQAGFTSLSGRPMSTGKFLAFAAAAYVLSLTYTVQSDGTNPSLLTAIAAALTAFANQFKLGPVYLGNNTLAEVIEAVPGVVPGTATFTGAIGGGVTTPAGSVLSISASGTVL